MPDWQTAECPDCGADAEADAQTDKTFVQYECPNGHFFVKKV